MEIKLFGKSLFEAKKAQSNVLWNTASDRLEGSKFLPDFYRDTGDSFPDYGQFIAINEAINPGQATKSKAKPKGKVKEKKAKIEITPKGVYQLQTLNDKFFKMKAEPEYVDKQIEHFKDKLGMIKSKEFDMNRGTIEIASILKRMENRKKYPEFKDYYDEFPYTSTDKIKELTKTHDHLKLGEVSQFLADMPQEAVDVMKKYTEQTKKLCEKEPVYYIIANKKDFQKTEKRRDPILLAQSPFGHFWQILGAWDEEMLLIEEL